MITNDLKYDAIALDTSIIEACGFNFSSGLLASLAQLKEFNVKVLIPEIVLLETIKRFSDRYYDTISKINKAIDLASYTFSIQGRDRDKAEEILIPRENPEVISKRIFETFLKNIQATVVPLELCHSIRPVIEDYFKFKPPFKNKKDKKYEFPDSICLASLENWAIQENTKVLVVTKDLGWIEYTQQSTRLMALDDLAKAISYFLPNEKAHHLKREFSSILKNHESPQFKLIAQKLSAFIQSLSLSARASCYYDFEVDTIQAELTNFSLNEDKEGFIDVVPIELSSDEYVFSLCANVSFSVSAVLSLFTYESSDRSYNIIGGLSLNTKDNLEAHIIVSCERNESISTCDNDVSVEISTTYKVIDLGNIEINMVADNFEAKR